MTTITRFAPSPTGFLHIGSARTALFNWLYARHTGGKFLLRVEDTDRARSTQPAIDAIFNSLRWLGLEWDGDAVFQFARAPRHAEVANQLIARGQAYRCYTTQAELDAFRKDHPNAKFRSPWRDGGTAPDAPFVIRLKAPAEGRAVSISDQVLGDTSVDSGELDDMVLLRSDGTPTYMLAVVVDDHDMAVTNIIRGGDHFTNTFRQCLLYDAMEWQRPAFAHIPLIHGSDGAKLSKRHGALGVEAYRDMGYLPEAVSNYLLRLGWSHGDDEIISRRQAIDWFGLDAVGKSPSRFDLAKLESVNAHYLREADDARLVDLICKDAGKSDLLLRAMPGLKQRAKNLNELAENAAFYTAARPLPLDAKATDLLAKGGRDLIRALLPVLEAHTDWQQAPLEQAVREFAEANGHKLGAVAQPLRAALSGKTVSPGVFEVMEILGKEESLGRLKDVC